VLLFGLFDVGTNVVLAEGRGTREAIDASTQAMFSPDPVDFGDVVVGEQKTLYLTFTNTTSTTVNFSRATGPYSGDLSGLDITDAVRCRNLNIAPTYTCTMEIAFTARAVGEVTATLTFYDNFTSGLIAGVPLRGRGVSAIPATTLRVAAAHGPYRGEVALSATLAGCAGSPADRAVALTITTAGGSRTVAAVTDAGGVATATVPSSVERGGVITAIPAGEYAPSAGWGVGATFAGGEGGAPVAGSAALTVERRAPALTFAAPPASAIYGGDPIALTVGSSAADDPAAPPLRLSYAPAAVCTGPPAPPATVTILGAGDCTVTLGQPAGDNANYSDAATVAYTIAIARATLILAWDAPSAIVHGTPLGSAQLRATASFGGSPLSG